MLPAPLSVIEFAAYRRRADQLLTADEQTAIVDHIAYDPQAGDLIPGTGGLRKLRIDRDGSGKRGGARVVYYFRNEACPVLLMALYAKNEKENLSLGEQRALADYAKEFVARWERR